MIENCWPTARGTPAGTIAARVHNALVAGHRLRRS
jgi:hypothetical protein